MPRAPKRYSSAEVRPHEAAIIGLPALNDCGTVDWKVGVGATNYASTAALEETLLCRDRTAAFQNMTTTIPQIGEFKHEP